jgi:hypothetical protein
MLPETSRANTTVSGRRPLSFFLYRLEKIYRVVNAVLKQPEIFGLQIRDNLAVFIGHRYFE